MMGFMQEEQFGFTLPDGLHPDDRPKDIYSFRALQCLKEESVRPSLE